jgi:hypothetical protein
MTLDDIIGDPLVDLFGENGPYPVGRTALGSADRLGLGQIVIMRPTLLGDRTMLVSMEELPRAATARLSVTDYNFVLAAHGYPPPTEGW